MFSRLSEIFSLFFRLGFIAFGGPAAHIALVHKEVVEKKKWMSDEEYLDLVGATALIPGPNSTEVVIHCGLKRGGFLGLLVAGLSFLIPACTLTGILAYLYVEVSHLPNFDQYLVGIKPFVIVLILGALQKLYKKAIKSTSLFFVALLVFGLSFLNFGEIYALLLGSFFGFLGIKLNQSKKLLSVEPVSLFLVFLKVGSILFGSGYVLITYLQDELIHKRAWLTATQLADAIALGQFTPGPVLSTSTFVGYLLSGTQGAALATVGIFLPSFIFVYLSHPFIKKMRSSQNLSIILDCVNAGSFGLMAYALYPLSQISLTNWPGIVTTIFVAALFFKFSIINSMLLFAISTALGFGLSLI